MRATLLAVCAVATLAGCTMASSPARLAAQATLAPTQGNAANGTVVFSEHDGKVLVEGDIKDLTPGLHGFHIHEKGDCSAADGTSAGGHFNPTGAQHGSPTSGAHHVGDMPMLIADANGRAKLHVELESLALQGDTSIIGKAVIIHANADDFQTQPTGNSGGRVACGVIVAK
ncbi:MAG: superoxide dismutase [Verrucomicrobiaceae bacterium]|nr:superoxide dismutase [Verrucomicrobiaceae bacterium]